ncbi:FAD-dependent thiol oxidase [Atractiella rhizophila]|nr:FAD-dependent thiol oxidase [Atractiella rhizophila]
MTGESSTSLPPGMVLGPDGKPCKACTSLKQFTAQGKFLKAQTTQKPCPPDLDQLGRHTWTFLHSTCSYFPETPSTAQKSSLLSLLKALPTLYPCHHCADHLGTAMKANPPDGAVEMGRKGVERWMCEMHNEVNGRLGKPIFDCSKAGERWRDGWKDGSCD